MAGPANLTQPQQRRFTRSSTISQIPSEALDGEFVPASLSHISDLLRVATDIEPINPRVAYLCRFHAFAKADRLDPSSKGRGVRQFKTALKLRLDKDDKVTATQRTEPSDAMELRKFYQAYHDHYIKALEEAGPKDRAQLAKIYQTAGILFEVLRAVDFEVEPELRAAGEDIKEKQNKFSTYNILPLDEGGADLAIMDLEEISATVGALRNTNALLWPSTSGQVKSSTPDLLDWLQAVFGFQIGNVANQKEHLILLLANMQACLDPTNHSKLELDNRAVGKLMDSLFANYNSWCNFLDRKSNIKTPVNLSDNQQDSQQYNLLYMGLYLLIWGESANVRFMPECLCYIFHMMASQLNLMLASTDVATLDKIVDGYGGENDSFTFLRRVVTPIYDVLQKEAANNKKGTAPHSAWRNYDDLNEFFWSKDCLKLQWPLEDNAEFFQTRSPLSSKSRQKRGEHGVQKVNFVEIRTFFHIFRSFDRMWSFYILALQTMVILSWSGTGSPFDLLHLSVLENLLSIFITAAVLRLGQALIEIALNYKSYHTPRHMVRPLLKLVVAVAWVIVLPICYVHSWENPNGILGALQHWLRPTGQAPSLYISAVAIYMLPNMISALLFLLPLVRRDLEKSKWKVFELLLWWLRPRLFVGRGMQEGPFSFLKYTLFWLVLLSAKLTFSYVIQINPLVKLTKAIIKVSNVRYEWHEFFPHDTNNLGAVISIWAPVLLVYFLDTQIWYSFMSALWGGFKGAYLRLGEIRTLGMLRSRFESLPKVFNDYLVSPDDGCTTISTEDGSSDHLSGKEIKKLKQAKFSQLWNEVIYSFRREDFISDKELDLLRIPFLSFSDPMLDMDLTRWPAFLLASKVPVAVNMAVEFDSKDQDPAKLWKRVGADKYRKAAVEECYKMFQLILDHLIVSTPERK